ncbi:hypothetical protein NQ176_g8605 [Zarea fungicola]|uniref:Uncharacterized protein n=1 Tax=Zarea fungicola TaxID=93591 RepID=A0ACC1MRA0_9HYPO|nr:hypothetical protein NQ176_g8605 [Lecanicillium fungicola]
MSTIALQPTSIHSNPIAATSTHARPQVFAAPSRKSMSVTQTYYLAHKARAKLSREAAQPDHDLRLLVGHANLLDSLMVELAEAEREQERWFNQSVRNSKSSTKNSSEKQQRHIQWADRIVEEAVEDEEYDEDSASDSDSDFDYEEEQQQELTVSAKPATITVEEMEEDEDMEEDYAQLELVRTPSHSTSPPELLIDHQDSDSSDDESMPPSPAEAALPLPAQQPAKDQQQVFGEEEFYNSRRNSTGLVSAIMVY